MTVLLNIINEALSFQACIVIAGVIAIVCIAVPLGVSLLRTRNSKRMRATRKRD